MMHFPYMKALFFFAVKLNIDQIEISYLTLIEIGYLRLLRWSIFIGCRGLYYFGKSIFYYIILETSHKGLYA